MLGHKKEKNFNLRNLVILITDDGKVQQYVQLQPNCTHKLRPAMKFLALKPCLIMWLELRTPNWNEHLV
jgi:hypothetical protein